MHRMTLQLRVFLLLCGCSVCLAEGSFEGPVSMSFSDSNLFTHLGTYGTQEQQGTLTLTSTNSFVSDSNVPSLGVATLQVATDEAGFSGGKLKKTGSRGFGGASRTPAAIKALNVVESLRVSIALLLFVGLLLAGLKKLPSRKPEVPGVPVDERTAETKTQLEEVKKLLPVAKRLAAAVSSDQSSKLLEVMQGALKKAGVATVEAKAKRKLKDALQALCMLQTAAIKRAEEIIRTDKDLPVLPPVVLREADEGDRLEWDTEQPIVLTYRSLCECSENLTHTFDEISKRLLSGQQFRNEKDGDVLLDTAISLESLLATSSFRRHLAAVAGDLRRDAFSSAKLSFLGKSELGIRNIEGHVALLRVRVALQENAREPAKQRETHVKMIEGHLEKVISVLDQLRSIAEAVRASTTMEAARETAARATPLESEATLLLEQCFSTVDMFLAPFDNVGGNVKILLESEAEKNMNTAEAESLVTLSKTVHEALDTIENARKKPSGRGAFKFNDGMLGHLKNSMERVSAQVQKHLERLKSSEQQPKEAQNAMDAINERLLLNAGMITQQISKLQAESLVLEFRLMAFLQEDMSYIVSELERIATRHSHLSDLGKQKYGQLQEQLSAALKSAENAPNLADAARAASNVRTLFLALQDFVLESSGRSSDLRS